MIGLMQTLKQLVSPGGIEGYFAVKYAQFARDTPAMRDEYRRLAAKTAAAIQAGQVLEIGPGPGFIAIEIAKLLPGVEVVGLDLSETMIDIATGNALEEGISERVAFREGDAAKMPFDDASFDLVISSGSLHHWQEPNRIFREVYRVLKPGCRALISDLRSDAPKDAVQGFAAQIDSRFMRWGLRHSFREGYTVKEAGQLVDGVPFAHVQVEVDGISMAIWLEKG
ncbi:MAG: class I SAM-dependent methyltransferase [Anaerolineae bacterium]|nr:class I SAM-dependent methyltransferase [Anaerolineae bacterium]